MPVERTLLFFKPDLAGAERAGEARIDLLNRLRERDLRVLRSHLLAKPELETLKKHYAEHEGKHFYAGLLEFVSKGPIHLFEVEGDDAIKKCREMVGPTDSNQARVEAPDSFRAKWGTDNRANGIHASGNSEAAKRELEIWAEFLSGGTNGIEQE